MNYRHAFHAGNFADVVKHVLLTRILVHLKRKKTPFRVIDTHAGLGHYDLGGEEAARTGEWRDGIGRLDEPLSDAAEDLIGPYRSVLAALRERRGAAAYPGSPAILREMLRPCDRAILIEKHPADAAVLTRDYNQVGTLKVLAADGWSTLPGLVPPPERRGLVFVDPPFEEPGEIVEAENRLGAAMRKWPTGSIAFWYPMKARTNVDRLAAGLTEAAGSVGARSLLRLEVSIAADDGSGRLLGTGLLVVNPPWTLAEEAEILLPELATRLARSGEGHCLIRENAVGVA